MKKIPLKNILTSIEKLSRSPYWKNKKIFVPQEIYRGEKIAYPIIALTTKKRGPALWLIAGIHGEEPAGPNALILSMDKIIELGKTRSIVLFPLGNPHGYHKNFRY